MKQTIFMIGIPAFAVLNVAANLIVSNHQSIGAWESFLVMVMLGVIGAITGLIANQCGAKGRTVFLALIVLTYLDVAIGGNLVVSWLTQIAAQWPVILFKLVRISALLSIFGLISVLLWRMRSKASAILFTVFLVSYMATILTPMMLNVSGEIEPSLEDESPISPTTDGVNTSGLYIHLIVDEFMAPAAFPDDVSGARELRARLYRFFEKFDFVVWDHAFSRHYMSGWSIPDMLNYKLSFTNTADGAEDFVGRATDLRNAAPYFHELSSRGLRVNVFQTQHMDFCGTEYVARCQSLESFNPFSEYLGEMGDLKLIYMLRTLHKAALLIPNSYFVNYLALAANKMPWSDPDVPVWLDGYAFPKWFDAITESITKAKGGESFFVHVLVPHAPYVLDEFCNYKGKPESSYELGKRYGYTDRAKSAKQRVRHYQRYFSQTHCVLNKLEDLMLALEAAGKLDDATIIINGDHGSRISEAFYVEHMNDDDSVVNYAALFSIKSPGVPARIDGEFASIQDLFARFMGVDVSQNLTRTFIIGLRENASYVRLEMPRF